MTTKSFIKTIGEKGLLADYNTEGKKLQTELTPGDRITIDGSTISADMQVFRAKYGTTTYAEVKAAYNAGKAVYCDDHILRALTQDTAAFFLISVYNSKVIVDEYYLNSSDHWFRSGKYVLQKELTFDTTPTAGSKNPVTSDGIKTALDSRVPAPTSTTGTQVLKCIDGVIQWVTE